MSEFWAGFVVQTPYIVVFLVATLLVNICLILANFRYSCISLRAKKSVGAVGSRIKDELELQLLRESRLDARISELEQRLTRTESKANESEEEVNRLHRDLSASMTLYKQSSAMILKDMKKEMLHGVASIEKLEAKLGCNDMCKDSAPRWDQTLSFHLDEFHVATESPMQKKPINGDKRRPGTLPRQLIVPDIHAERAKHEVQPENVLSLVSNCSKNR